MEAKQHTNALIEELSAYLLQHAHNPVNWFPWTQSNLEQAQGEGKLLLISIGYASCHWCHVMEHECFEDEEVAALMNANYINIKVDREERPDVDQVYMNALQLISGQGGWPLNMIALPDGRPIWGGTYFPKERWMQVLTQISKLAREKPEELIQYADNLEKGLAHFEVDEPLKEGLNLEEIAAGLDQLVSKKDAQNGGLIGAPKFMMPTLLRFFQQGGILCSNKDARDHFHFSLERMALGGVFDAVHGGFSRYAVDAEWHIPHFEKMGYDNGQLISLYAQAHREEPKALYQETIDKTISFLKKELYTPEGGFYAALDADSLNANQKLVEGAFYVWTKNEIQELFPKEYLQVAAYYAINDDGYWEDGNYVLRRMQTDEVFAKLHGLELSELKVKVISWNVTLLKERNKRARPRLDDKIICSWNAILSSGFLDAYRSFGDSAYKDLALKNLAFIEANFVDEEGELKRISKKGVNKIDAFLEDYAAVIKLYIDAYETVFDEHYILQAEKIMNVCQRLFKDKNGPLFYFSSSSELVVRTKEKTDNVIPSSNAVMAENLIRLSNHLVRPELKLQAEAMVLACKSEIISYPRSYSYWLAVGLRLLKPGYEVVAVGPNAKKDTKKLQQSFTVNCSWAAAETSTLPLFRNRVSEGKTKYYLCRNNQCGIPLESQDEVQRRLQETANA
ncbi:thioredoxin domain-containing protein [Flavobacteriaceae bacterium]|nr:thioredoxin domain-containing protein [Flavobacteriaceae bacterium]